MVCERELTAPAWCMVVDLEGLTYREEAVVADVAIATKRLAYSL